MPSGTYFQKPTAPPPARTNSSNALNQPRRQGSDLNSTSKTTSLASDDSPDSNTAVTELMEAIDSFCTDVEKKYKTAGKEILAKLDEMAARCDRIESELLLNTQSEDEDPNRTSADGDNT